MVRSVVHDTSDGFALAARLEAVELACMQLRAELDQERQAHAETLAQLEALRELLDRYGIGAPPL